MNGVWSLVALILLISYGGYRGYVLFRRGRTFSCPACARAVSRDAIRFEGIDCPFCGWRAIRTALSATRATQTENLDPAFVQLWDGKDYDRRQLKKSSRRLSLAVADRSSRLRLDCSTHLGRDGSAVRIRRSLVCKRRG
jgi:hypothetical protein